MFISTIGTLMDEIMSHAPELGSFKEEMLEALGKFEVVKECI